MELVELVEWGHHPHPCHDTTNKGVVMEVPPLAPITYHAVHYVIPHLRSRGEWYACTPLCTCAMVVCSLMLSTV